MVIDEPDEPESVDEYPPDDDDRLRDYQHERPPHHGD